MTTARKQLVSIESTPYYHCVSRCVRRSFLCGIDPYSQKSYEHRRSWVEGKIKSLAQFYCIDVCAYAIMSNHYHLVLHINRDKALTLSSIEVAQRWLVNHKPPALIQRWLTNQAISNAEKKSCLKIIDSWRNRLWNVSWFMKELNYEIAVRANQEDDCKGHFWECRFKSQALLDEKALVAAMVYVDLNPLRVGETETPEESEFTSIKTRIVELKRQYQDTPFLYPLLGNQVNKMSHGIPIKLMDYLDLIDWTARQYRPGKIALRTILPNILERLNVNSDTWNKAISQLEQLRITAIGCHRHVSNAKYYMKKTRIHLLRLD